MRILHLRLGTLLIVKLLFFMDWKTSLDWYCSGNKLDNDDIELLENEYQRVLKAKNNEVKLEVAPQHICNQTKIAEDSLWIKAVAVVLDRLSPIKAGTPRRIIIDKLKVRSIGNSFIREKQS